MKIFLDTEFTGFQEDPKLISIALVAEDGRELYVELNGWSEDDCCDFVIENVLPKLKGEPVCEAAAGDFVRGFLWGFDHAEICTDSPAWDFSFFMRLVGFKLPENILRFPHDLSSLVAESEECAHNALADARALAAAYRSASRKAY